MPASTGGMIINELQFAPLGTGAIDANNDGSTNALDNAVELYNNGASSVDLTGWELWYTNNNGASATLIAALGSSTVASGDYYTIVETSTSFVDLTNVGDGQESDLSFYPNTQSTYALYNPAANEYVLLTGVFAGTSTTTMVSAIEAAHPLALQAGATESYGAFSPSGPASVERVNDGSDTWQTDSATLGAANCFAAGTMIAAADGETPVEALQIGDLVRTIDGRTAPVKWIGQQMMQLRFWGQRAQPVRIRAGALGGGLPHNDLTVTADHGMIVDGLVINASALINGTSIDWVPLAELPERFTVYHVETQAHDVILANGAPSETYLDLPGRRTFDNYAEYLDLYGAERTIPEMDRPRISARRLLPDAIRARLGINGAGLSRTG